MIAFLQRVTSASVRIGADTVAAIDEGVLALIGVEVDDGPTQVAALSHRLLAYRIFSDDAGRMQRGLRDTGGGLLLVPQFTLCADTRRGLRPGFSRAAPPERARAHFDAIVDASRAAHSGHVASGVFGADMQVALVNNGPVSFWLQV